MTERTDVLVLGAGPAGSTLAALAAASGLRVIVVDRTAFPRDKVCGEFLSAEGCRVLDRLGLLASLRQSGARRIEACRISSTRKAAIELPLPDLGPEGREALGVSRHLMDRALAQTASDRGAVLRERTRAVEPLTERGRVVGYRLRSGRSREPYAVRATVVVAADGRRSDLARRLHPHLCDPATRSDRSWFGIKAHFESATPIGAGLVELHLFDRGYAGLAPVEGDRRNLCAMVTAGTLRACGGKPDRVLEERMLANPSLREALGAPRRTGAWQAVGPLRFGVRRPAASGALFVGDAAGTVDPFCGEGMTHALAGAELAAPFLTRAVEQGGLTPDQARDYDTAWRRRFATVTRKAGHLGWVLARPAIAHTALRLLQGVGARFAPRLVAATRTGTYARVG